MKKNQNIICIIYSVAFLLVYSDGVSQILSKFSGVPEPQYEVRLEKSKLITMRDGIRLSTDLYFPEITDKELPVILIRTPYKKNNWRDGEI